MSRTRMTRNNCFLLAHECMAIYVNINKRSDHEILIFSYYLNKTFQQAESGQCQLTILKVFYIMKG